MSYCLIHGSQTWLHICALLGKRANQWAAFIFVNDRLHM